MYLIYFFTAEIIAIYKTIFMIFDVICHVKSLLRSYINCKILFKSVDLQKRFATFVMQIATSIGFVVRLI